MNQQHILEKICNYCRPEAIYMVKKFYYDNNRNFQQVRFIVLNFDDLVKIVKKALCKHEGYFWKSYFESDDKSSIKLVLDKSNIKSVLGKLIPDKTISISYLGLGIDITKFELLNLDKYM